jgi:4-hydroxyphenylacetate 3-monooxygenase oxygenase component
MLDRHGNEETTVGARNGKEFLEGLKDGREVWLDGNRVADVTTCPSFAGAAQSMAELFDLQHEHPEELLFTDADSGERVNVTHLIPRSKDDLVRRRRALERIAHHTIGLMGRSPDYLNVTMAGFAGRVDVWAENDNDEGAANLVRFQREAMINDWSMTHAIVNPTVDKAIREVDSGAGKIVLHLVGETNDSYVVRGARALATLAPFSDEMVVYPGQPIPRDATDYALSFSIPMRTPGLRVLCRDSYASHGNPEDHPLSSKYDEQDAVVIFDDVEVPKERMFLVGDPQIYNKAMTTGWVANIMQQTTVRAHVKLTFAWQLATRMAQAVNADTPAVNEMLGELWSYAELTRSVIEAAEAGAHEWGNGVWFCDERPFRAIRPTLPRWFPRVNEIIKLLGSHSLLATPTSAEMANPELRPMIDLYYQGAEMDADERIAIFRTAWDFVGSALAGRGELYERFYLASSQRMYQVAHAASIRETDLGIADRVIQTAMHKVSG